MQKRCFSHQDWVSPWGSMLCLESHNPRMLLLKLTQETVAYLHTSRHLKFLLQSVLLVSICYFQMKQTWKSVFLTHRTVSPEPLGCYDMKRFGSSTRSGPQVSWPFPSALSMAAATSSSDNDCSPYGNIVQAGICGIYGFSINRLSLILLISWRVGRKGSIIPIV